MECHSFYFLHGFWFKGHSLRVISFSHCILGKLGCCGEFLFRAKAELLPKEFAAWVKRRTNNHRAGLGSRGICGWRTNRGDWDSLFALILYYCFFLYYCRLFLAMGSNVFIDIVDIWFFFPSNLIETYNQRMQIFMLQ